MSTQSNITATIATTKGNIVLSLFDQEAPLTVANFVNLSNRGFYNGLKFHRVIADFMIQGGCPEGTGTGGPGYQFDDEFHASLCHNKAGILSMANSGPGTNGSQFFITHGPTDWLDNKHSVFGVISCEQDKRVVDSITQSDEIIEITISGELSRVQECASECLPLWNAALDKGFPNLSPAQL
jgi:peptidyl-prolyl cis-trans isomerase B (cyclophilin B)